MYQERCLKIFWFAWGEHPVPEDVLEGKPGDAHGLDEAKRLVILVGQGRG